MLRTRTGAGSFALPCCRSGRRQDVRFAGKRARQSCATFVAISTCVIVAAAHPCVGAVLQTAQLITCCFLLAIGISGGMGWHGESLRKGDRIVMFEAVRCHGAATGHIQHAGTVPATERSS